MSGMHIYEKILSETLNEVSFRFTGKDAAYVLKDADLKKAARLIA